MYNRNCVFGSLAIILHPVLKLFLSCRPEVEFPIESTVCQVGPSEKLEGFVRNDVDNGTNDIGAIFVNFVQQRFEPSR